MLNTKDIEKNAPVRLQWQKQKRSRVLKKDIWNRPLNIYKRVAKPWGANLGQGSRNGYQNNTAKVAAPSATVMGGQIKPPSGTAEFEDKMP